MMVIENVFFTHAVVLTDLCYINHSQITRIVFNYLTAHSKCPFTTTAILHSRDHHKPLSGQIRCD